jgi:hypothetical protein
MNSRKHALLAKTIVTESEDPAEFEELLRSLLEEFNPNPGCEYELVLLLASKFWRLRRIPRLEAFSLRAQQTEIVYRDPRTDRLIEEEIARRKKLEQIAGVYLQAKKEDEKKIRDEPVDDEQIRASYNKLLPPEANQPLRSPSENQETLAKISRYETALVNSLSRTLNMLIGLQNMRTERADSRALKLVSRPSLL